jgi:glutamyl-tRNA reductase
MITVYISKYALTEGIFEKEGDISDDFPELFLWYKKGEWHHTLEEAQAKAEQMRIKKIASLQKQLAKLEKLSFTVIEP